MRSPLTDEERQALQRAFINHSHYERELTAGFVWLILLLATVGAYFYWRLA